MYELIGCLPFFLFWLVAFVIGGLIEEYFMWWGW